MTRLFFFFSLYTVKWTNLGVFSSGFSTAVVEIEVETAEDEDQMEVSVYSTPNIK